MGQLVYTTICSLDGYVADASGEFRWAVPDEEVLAAINADTERFSTYLYGRRIYETMHVWATDPAAAQMSPESARFARIWQEADKVVYSTTLQDVVTARTRLEREFDPGAVERIKASATGDVSVDGPTLAAHALRHGVVDQVQLFVVPTLIGGGLPAFPDDVRTPLRLEEQRAFAGGFVFLRYAVQRG